MSKCLAALCLEEPVDELALKSVKDPLSFETSVRTHCRQFMIESSLFQEQPLVNESAPNDRDSEEDPFDQVFREEDDRLLHDPTKD